MNSESDLDFRSIVSALRRYWLPVVVTSMLAALIGYSAASGTETTYTAVAYVEVVDPVDSGQSNRFPTLDEIEARRESIAVLFESPTVFRSVREALGDGASSLRSLTSGSVESNPAAGIVEIVAVADDEAIALQAANSAIEVAAEVRRDRAEAELQPTLDRLNADVDVIDDRIRDLNARIRGLDQGSAASSVAGYVAPGDVPTPAQLEAQLASKQQADDADLARRQLSAAIDQQVILGTQIRDVTLSVTSLSIAFRPYEEAAETTSSTSQPMQSALLAGLAALILAAGIAFLASYTDGRLGRHSAAEAARLKMPLLGSGSARARAARHASKGGVPPDHESIGLALAHRYEGQPLAIGVMSADHDREFALDMALTLSKAGRHVVLVDADLRGTSTAVSLLLPGLGSVLRRENHVQDVLVPLTPSTASGSLKLLAAGEAYADPLALMHNSGVDALVGALNRVADCLVFALGPSTSSPESLTVLSRMDGAIIVGRVDTTRRAALQALRDGVNSVGTHLIGLVIVERSSRHKRNRRFERIVTHGAERVARSAADSTSIAAESPSSIAALVGHSVELDATAARRREAESGAPVPNSTVTPKAPTNRPTAARTAPRERSQSPTGKKPQHERRQPGSARASAAERSIPLSAVRQIPKVESSDERQ